MNVSLWVVLWAQYFLNYTLKIIKKINILNHKVYKQYIKEYFRYYVDDTFILFNGTNRQAEIIVNNLNKINSKIDFLDVTISILSNNIFNYNK